MTGAFSLTLKVNGDDAVIVNVTCDGRQVFQSNPVQLSRSVTKVGLGSIDARAHLDADGCRELADTKDTNLGNELIARVSAVAGVPVDHLLAQRPRECATQIVMVVEGAGSYSGPGSHWIVSKDRVSGDVRVESGL
ncbi:hypothetical protein L2Y96_06675 [Luteibacter aegosomaticola]|uniref:hypothetical protein n=1 Tax=Luteibacter aegosomaticola TaxID=2911538 RepID=UPI001FF9150F|nr:hypothetical protein [Luteibacter aegosomaticola]UPG91452.1 hypothetical protein L2Y96_06675 [Luteibacter aegosomaticola]